MSGDDLWQNHLDAVGTFIKQQRRMAELSQRELARLAKVSDTYMSQLERGMHEPSIRVLKSIAAGLGIPAERFIAYAAGVSGVPISPVTSEEAIRADERLTEEQRRALLAVLSSYLDANARPAGD